MLAQKSVDSEEGGAQNKGFCAPLKCLHIFQNLGDFITHELHGGFYIFTINDDTGKVINDLGADIRPSRRRGRSSKLIEMLIQMNQLGIPFQPSST